MGYGRGACFIGPNVAELLFAIGTWCATLVAILVRLRVQNLRNMTVLYRDFADRRVARNWQQGIRFRRATIGLQLWLRAEYVVEIAGIDHRIGILKPVRISKRCSGHILEEIIAACDNQSETAEIRWWNLTVDIRPVRTRIPGNNAIFYREDICIILNRSACSR